MRSLEVSANKTNYLLMYREQNAGKMTTWKEAINPLQMLQSSDIWEQP